MRESFTGKVLVLSGGTGSFGNTVLNRFLDYDFDEIRIFSRDEKKQEDMRKFYNHERLKFFIGDVRDYRSVQAVVEGADYVFHAAALKQVPSCEFFPMEAVKTNVIGTNNVLDASIKSGVQRVVCLSTDKAVYPINAMGISKAMMEKVAVSKARLSNKTKICITRYGNVMASRGSVIPLFVNQILSGQPLTITDPNMTRFMMSLSDAVNLVLYAFNHAQGGDIFVQKAPAATVETLVDALKHLYDVPNHEVKVMGTRHGEKLYEALLSREEVIKSDDLGDYFRVPCDERDMNYGAYTSEGEISTESVEEYTSHNTTRLDKQGTLKLLQSINLTDGSS